MDHSSPLTQALRWLAAHAAPASRLPPAAETLVLVAALAGREEFATAPRPGSPAAGSTTFNAQLRRYTIQRRRVHVKCDNSAKV